MSPRSVGLFLQEGIQAVGVARIVEQAGVAPMTLYRHFGGKDGLVVAVLEQLVKPLDVTDPPAVAARLQLLVEGAEAVAVAGGPVGAPDLRALSEAARC